MCDGWASLDASIGCQAKPGKRSLPVYCAPCRIVPSFDQGGVLHAPRVGASARPPASGRLRPRAPALALEPAADQPGSSGRCEVLTLLSCRVAGVHSCGALAGDTTARARGRRLGRAPTRQPGRTQARVQPIEPAACLSPLHGGIPACDLHAFYIAPAHRRVVVLRVRGQGPRGVRGQRVVNGGCRTIRCPTQPEAMGPRVVAIPVREVSR
jgi:hypothetical protein